MKSTNTSSFGSPGRINHDSARFYNSRMYSHVRPCDHMDESGNELPHEAANRLICGTAENMKELPDACVHLMITSPPYNASKEYDEDLSLEEYLQLLYNSFRETYRVLVPGGRACINVANLGRKPYIPLSHHISQIMDEIGYNMRGEIIWNKASSASPSTAWGSWMSASNPTLRDIHEYILIFSKGDYKRESKGKVNTIEKEQFMEWTKSIWTMNAERASRVNHPAPFPVELPYRLIQMYSFKGDVILDPFIGSGTTAVAAVQSGRRYVGYDTNPEYLQNAENRIGAVKNTLPLGL